MNIDISIVSPFYNEQAILAAALEKMVINLDHLKERWELVIVNDGSTDDSLEIAKQYAEKYSRIKIVSYSKNQGRGHALKKGIDAAIGEYIVTTEIDCSWGDNIVAELTQALRKNPKWDIVIASTKLSGGGYINVPQNRILLSKLANIFLQWTVSKHTSMYTGMTRGYRASSIKHLPVSEKGKEFHLDVLLKARSLGLNIGEIPATITWQTEKLQKQNMPKRKSSTKTAEIIRSHILFGLSGRPYRYLFTGSILTGLLALFFLTWGVSNFIHGIVSIYLLLAAFSGGILSILLSGIAVLSLQQNTILREIWLMRKEMIQIKITGGAEL